jgi:hypothetical protein
MWLKKKKPSEEVDAPEKLRYSRYYEHDGILRAYANRAMVLAFLCIPTTMLALAFAAYVRLQPPTVIRVDENGLATILGINKPAISVTQGPGSEPTEFEKRAFVRLFLERYLNFSPTNVSRNWADSLNMMTANLRRTAYAGMQKDDFIGKIEDDQTTSDFQMRSLEASKEDPLTYTAFGVKEGCWWKSGRSRIPAVCWLESIGSARSKVKNAIGCCSKPASTVRNEADGRSWKHGNQNTRELCGDSEHKRRWCKYTPQTP